MTSGGDAPGMNPCVRAVVRTALGLGLHVKGIRRAFEGLMAGDFVDLGPRDVGGIIQKGGTGSDSRIQFAFRQALNRTASADEMGAKVAELTAKGATTRALWEGLLLGAGELLMRAPGIIGLHTLTTLNALHFAHQNVANADTPKLLLLQAGSFLPMFREAIIVRDKKMGDAKIDDLQPREEQARFGVADVYKDVGNNRATAARTAMTYLKANPNGVKELTDEGRRLIFMKGTDAHDYKFSTAVLEDLEAISPAWRDRFLAASLFWMKGSEVPDSPLVKRTHAALA